MMHGQQNIKLLSILQSTLRNIPEDRRSYLKRGGSLKSLIIVTIIIFQACNLYSYTYVIE
jgi:hypothetical protein